ncbi:hypothetical protein [Kitasatospora acidiphila]|uniref:hypothetical protein n=1 Tax=Kitasatospora acidiphila TaxID=2567942 RepID=UPI003C73A0A1
MVLKLENIPVSEGEGLVLVEIRERSRDSDHAAGWHDYKQFNDDAWLIHTDDGQVSINGDLRVHGAFRSGD